MSERYGEDDREAEGSSLMKDAEENFMSTKLDRKG